MTTSIIRHQNTVLVKVADANVRLTKPENESLIMETITEIAKKNFFEAILISSILGYFISKREERMKKTIDEEFSKRDWFFDVSNDR